MKLPKLTLNQQIYISTAECFSSLAFSLTCIMLLLHMGRSLCSLNFDLDLSFFFFVSCLGLFEEVFYVEFLWKIASIKTMSLIYDESLILVLLIFLCYPFCCSPFLEKQSDSAFDFDYLKGLVEMDDFKIGLESFVNSLIEVLYWCKIRAMSCNHLNFICYYISHLLNLRSISSSTMVSKQDQTYLCLFFHLSFDLRLVDFNWFDSKPS